MSSHGNALKLSDIVEPDAALRAAMDLYGVDATTAVAHCALTAHYDGRAHYEGEQIRACAEAGTMVPKPNTFRAAQYSIEN